MRLRWFLCLTLLASALASASPLTRDAVIESSLHPYEGPVVRGVDPSTLEGKVLCGYQGWFDCENDGAGRGWTHWTKGPGVPSPENIKVDLWPDLSEFPSAERFPTEFHHADGRVAELFSSYNKGTVLRHFEWMKTYGIDGAFVQRFASELGNPRAFLQRNTVLTNCREGANRTGRVYALMYDLSGMPAGKLGAVFDDSRLLRERMRLGEDPAYLHHHGKPLVAVWGVGFSDRRAYTLSECASLVEALKNDGCTVILGVPTYWRELKDDAVNDPKLHEIIRAADIVSPWSVGRYGDPEGARQFAQRVVAPDIAWCAQNHLAYLPVAFPGFSWHHMNGGPLNQIPRRKGEFFWAQVQADFSAGARMAYVAMFDEVDEGTAIFKCASDVGPADEGGFVNYEGLPSDYYLRLAGRGGKLLRGEIPANAPLPSP